MDVGQELALSFGVGRVLVVWAPMQVHDRGDVDAVGFNAV